LTELTDFASLGQKMFPANSCHKLPKVVAYVSKSNRAPKPSFKALMTAISSPTGAFSPNLATLSVTRFVYLSIYGTAILNIN